MFMKPTATPNRAPSYIKQSESAKEPPNKASRQSWDDIPPDAGDSAAISSIFLRLIIFPVGWLRRPCPGAGIPLGKNALGDDAANR